MDFTCKGCSLSFKDQFSFFIHYFSNLCVAKQTESIEKENRTVLDLKHLRTNDVCEICGKICWPFEGLAKHILTHVGAMPYFCPFCHFSSLSKVHLQTHISFHSKRAKNGIQKFPSKLTEIHVCDHCNCAFTDWRYLAIHYVTHLKEAPFKCSICCMMFLEKDDFNIHRHLHNIFPFCEFCQISFNNRLDCLEHVLTHNKSKMFRKFSLVVPYERLMRLKTSWYHDFISDSSICEQHLFSNPNPSYGFLKEENDSSNFGSHKESKLLYLNCPSSQTGSYQPSAFNTFGSDNKINNSESADFGVRESVVNLCKAALKDRKEDELICRLFEKSVDSDSLNCEGMHEMAIKTFKNINKMKTFSENQLDANITITSDVCANQRDSTESSVHPIKCSNAKLEFKKTSDNLTKLPNYVQNIESYRNFHNLQSQELKLNFNKLCNQTNFRSAVLNKNSQVSEDKLSDNNMQLSHKTLPKRSVTDYDFYTMQFTSNHSKPMFDYSVHNNHKIIEVEVRENVSHLCEVLFEEGKEDISQNCDSSKKFANYDSTSKKSPDASLNSFKYSNMDETSKKKLNGNVTLPLPDGQYNLAKVLNNNYTMQQLNYCKDTNTFNEEELMHETSPAEKETIDLVCDGNNQNDEMYNKDLTYNKDSVHYMFYKNSEFDYHLVNTHPLSKSISFPESHQNQPVNSSKIWYEAEHDNLYSSFYGRKPSSTKANEINCLIDLVRNLKDVFIILEKLPDYVHDMSSFRKYKRAKNNPNKYFASANQKDSKMSWLRAKRSMLHRVKKKNFTNTTCNSGTENASSDMSTFSESSSSPNEMLPCLHGNSQSRKICGTQKNKAYSRTKMPVAQSSVKYIPPEMGGDSSATETCSDSGSSSDTEVDGDSSATETCSDSDSSSDISDFMQRWLLNSSKNSERSSSKKNTFSFARTKKPIAKLCKKQPYKHSRKLQSLSSIQAKKLFVHLTKLPDYIYEKHKKRKPIMLTSLFPVIEKTEHVLKKQQATSQVLHDHSYCFPSVSCSILVEHNYS